MAGILQYCMEAKYGAKYSLTMVKKAFNKFTSHPRYTINYKDAKGIIEQMFKN